MKNYKTALFILPLSLLIACGGEKKEEKKEETSEKEEVKEEPKEEKYVYTYEVIQEDVKPGWMVSITTKGLTVEKIGETLGSNYGMMMPVLQKSKKVTGAPFAIYHNWTDPTQPFDMEAALPVSDSTLKVKTPMELKKTYGGKVLKVVYFGNYAKTETAYNDIHAFMKENNLSNNGSPWEVYITDPMIEKDTSKWQTDIYFPVK